MSESVLAGVPVDRSSADGHPMAGIDRTLHAVIDAIAVLGRYFPRRRGRHVSGDPPTGEGQFGGAGGEIPDQGPARLDPCRIHGL